MGTLQVGGTTLGTKNSNNKIELENSFLKESGSIVQVQYTQLTTTHSMQSISTDTDFVLQQSGSSVSGGAVSGILDVNITPKITGSKIWLQSHIMGEMDADDVWNLVFFYWRSVGSTHTALKSAISGGTVGQKGITAPTRTYHQSNADSTPEIAFYQYFDTHGVSAGTQITYKVGIAHTSAATTRWDTNRTINGVGENGISSICAIELAP